MFHQLRIPFKSLYGMEFMIMPVMVRGAVYIFQVILRDFTRITLCAPISSTMNLPMLL